MPVDLEDRTLITVEVNGKQRNDSVPTRLLLVDYIREVVGLTGTHVGCDTSSCGACTVLVDGRTVKSCTMFAVQADGRSIKTIEAVAEGSTLHPVQESFRRNHALQCGYCTPGMVMSTLYLLSENPEPTEEEVRQAIAGNICRCTGYENIVKAILDASAHKEAEQGTGLVAGSLQTSK